MLDAIGKELKTTRNKANKTLETVAKDLKISIETLRRYENSCIGLSVERLEELLEYYKVNSSIFFRNVCEYMHKTD